MAGGYLRVVDEPPTSGDSRYDVLLAGLAEWLTAKDGLAAPPWAAGRALTTWWFPSDTPAGRADALVHAPAALGRRGVSLPRWTCSEHDCRRAFVGAAREELLDWLVVPGVDGHRSGRAHTQQLTPAGPALTATALP